jgi:outer membrane biosynthesis protein TonB
MIRRILVPPGARMSAEDAASTRRRPSTLDERTLVPSTMPMTKLDATTTIPANLPLESIATRTVVPRDINVEAVQRRDDSDLPPQPTDMDSRITVPQVSNSRAELDMRPVSYISEDLVEPDIIQTGEVSFLQPDRPSQKTLGEKITTVVSVLLHILLVLAIIFEPKFFSPRVRTPEEEEIARKQIIPLLPPGALEEALKPTPKPAVPHEAVRVDPRTIRKVAPPRPPDPTPVPTPEQPKRDLPSAPQPNVVPAPQPEKTPTPGIIPKAPVQLEKPELPVPQKGLNLPRQLSPGDTIRDAARGIKPNAPVPMGDVNPSGGGGGRGSGTQGAGFGGVEILTDTQGVDFNDYIRRLLVIVKRNWYSVMPPSVQLGDSGKVGLRFKIMANGGVPDDDPHPVFGSGKEPLDRAAFSSIRASNPFPPLPPGFKGPYIELRIDYYYNLPLPTQ